MNGPLLAIFPHPDDETFTAGGLLAAARERGIGVTLVCATRGEAGESAIPGLDHDDVLGEVRERELREAMAKLDVDDVRFLGFRDSGMEGSAEAGHPHAFVRAPICLVASQLADLICEIRPEVIVTFGPEGVYGHPDHLHLHEAAVEAVLIAARTDPATAQGQESWRTPSLYFGTAPREDMLAIFDRPNSPLPSLSETARANLGTPRGDITHVLDVRHWDAPKRAAIKAHFTQTGEGGPLGAMPSEALEARIGWEHFVRAELPWGKSEEPQDLLDLLNAR